MPAARACTRISRSTICSTLRPSTRQLISQVSISQTPASEGGADDGADHPVVPEDIRQPDLKGKDVRVVLGVENFRIGVAAGGQIILVGLVDKLHDARAASSVEGFTDRAPLAPLASTGLPCPILD
jgi:hypothetical protein